jgi:hypothetical protein
MRLAGMEPDPWQLAAFQSPYRQALWLWHRQAGKSTAVAAKAWEMASNKPGSLTLLVSRSLRQSGELFRKVRLFHQAATRPVGLLRDTALTLETTIGSRIISLPAHPDTVVGYSAPDLVIIDEAARVPDMLCYALRPMLAMSRGTLIALTTPWGKRGWFFDAWQGKQTEQALDLATVQSLLADLGMTVTEEELAEEPADAWAWHKMMLPATQNPRLSKRFLANERRSVPDLIFRSEWLCEFVDTEDTVFRYDDVQAMLSDEVMPLWDTRQFHGWVSESVHPLFGAE